MSIMKIKPARVYFIGAGPGSPELITVKGARLLKKAACIVYAGSLVAPSMLEYCSKSAVKIDSSGMDLKAFMEIIIKNAKANKTVVRLSAGDPALYGALREQTALLESSGIDYEIIPGVSSAFASAAAIKRELTIPLGTQTVIFTRMKGRTPVPASEGLAKLARIKSTICIFLSADKISGVVKELKKGGLKDGTPVAVVYRVSWPDELSFITTLAHVEKKMMSLKISRQAMIIVGRAVGTAAVKSASRLYDKSFTHGYRLRAKR